MKCHDNPIPEITFYPLEADGDNYPKAAVPLLPPPSWCGLFSRKHVSAETAFLQGGESFIQGRYALAEALRRAGVGSGKTVLLPAFHCRAIVEPVLYLGAQPCFYPVMADLKPDFSAITSLQSDEKSSLVAMVITHYFGFPNAIEEAERFCTAHGIALIEDCAHALYGRSGERLLGTVGRYATASIWKFLPVRDGAILLDNTGGQSTNRTAQPWLTELKSLAAIIQSWEQRVWFRASLPDIDVSELGEQAKNIAAQPFVQIPESGLKEFIPGRDEMLALRSSRWLMTHAAHERIARCRRANYSRWLEGVRSLPGVQPLFPDLPEGVVPCAFPLLIDKAGMAFHLLKMTGVPFWRWEDMAVTDCVISYEYRIRLLQLPCHQELHADELDWMIHAIHVLSSELEKSTGT